MKILNLIFYVILLLKKMYFHCSFYMFTGKMGKKISTHLKIKSVQQHNTKGKA